MTFKPIQKMVLSSFFLALAFVLPFLTAGDPTLGNIYLPMHIPILLCGYFCGWKYGLMTGLIAPIFRSLLIGMPPMFPIAVSMSFELGAFGFLTGFLHQLLPHNKIKFLYVSLIGAMIGGRFVAGVANTILYSVSDRPYGFEAFVTASFVVALPGIIIQLAMIPILVNRIEIAQQR